MRSSLFLIPIIPAALLFSAPHAHADVNECIAEFDHLRPEVHAMNVEHCTKAWANALNIPAPLQPAPAPLQPAPAPPAPPVKAGITVTLSDQHGYENMQLANVTFGTALAPTPYRLTVDTGCSNMSISRALADWLLSTNQATLEGNTVTTLADGRVLHVRKINIAHIEIDGHGVDNARAADSAPGQGDGDMLLGIGVLKAFGRFTIDTDKHTLTLGG